MKFNSSGICDVVRLGTTGWPETPSVSRRTIKHKLKWRYRLANAHALPPQGGHLIGHGLVVVDIKEFSRLLSLPANAFLNRYFTESELSAAGDGVTRAEKLAGRFAIKEAVLKALYVGWGDGVSFTDVETRTHVTGAPSVVLHRKLAALQKKRNIVSWLVSSSHTDIVAVGSAIALGN